jgi:hypothetical protein
MITSELLSIEGNSLRLFHNLLFSDIKLIYR